MSTARVERETMRVAAEAARTLISKLKISQSKLEARISFLQSVVTAWESISGKNVEKPRDQPGVVADPRSNGGKRKRAKKGQVENHIDSVLNKSVPTDIHNIMRLISDQLGIQYSRTSIFSALKRKEETGKYIKDDQGLWRLSVLNANGNEKIIMEEEVTNSME